MERWLFEEYRVPSNGFGLFRILYALVLLVYWLPTGLWVAGMPPSLLDPPPGMTFLASTLPPASFFQALNFVLVVAGVCVLFGRYTLWSSFVISGCLLALNSWAYAFGKINHGILFVLLPAFMALAGWGGSHALDASKDRRTYNRGWPMALFALAIGLAMFSTAFTKAATGWLDPSTRAVQAHVATFMARNERAIPVAQASLVELPALVWEMADLGAVMLEASFLFCVVRRSSFQVVCAFGTLFHLAIMAMMQIYYVANLVAYAAFVDWWKVERRLPRWIDGLDARAARIQTREVALMGCALGAVYVLWGNPIQESMRLLGTAQPDETVGLVGCALAAAAGACYLIARLLVRA